MTRKEISFASFSMQQRCMLQKGL